jgi:hypothetical protein
MEGLLLFLFVGALIDVLTGERGSEGWALVAISVRRCSSKKLRPSTTQNITSMNTFPSTKNYRPVTLAV